MWPNPYETANLVTFTEEALNGKCYFLSSEGSIPATSKMYFPIADALN